MKRAFVNGVILDGTRSMVAVRGKSVLVNGQTIVAIVDAGSEPADYARHDLQGAYLMPGLINLHVHLPAGGKPQKKQRDLAKLVRLVTSNPITRAYAYEVCKKAAMTQLASGVTTLRTVGGIQDIDARLRDAIKDGRTQGPRILAGNEAVSVPGGHMAGSLAFEARSEQEARHYVRQIAKGNPDLIKLMITGGVLDATEKGEPGVLKMPFELVKAACDEAHSLGYAVAAHVESPEGLRVALEGGVDTIEHGAKPDAEIIELFKRHRAALVTTISPAIPYALFDRSVSNASEMEQFNGQVVFDGIVECAKACLEHGIPVGLGTDTGCPFITHWNMWRELVYFQKYCGVTAAFALHTATLGNARIVGLGDVIGSIEVGKCADFIISKQNPLDDLAALRHLDAVVVRGELLQGIRPKKDPAIDRELDKFL